MVKQQHTIRKQTIQLQFHKQTENLFIQQKITEVIKERLMPALETLFDKKTSANNYIKIDTLDIKLENLNSKNWEHELVECTLRKVKSKLDEIRGFASEEEDYEVEYIDNVPHVDKLKSGVSEIEALKYFIKYGLLPWNFQKINIHELLQSTVMQSEQGSSQTALKKVLTDAILYSSNSLERFFLQFTQEEIQIFLETIFHHKYNIENAVGNNIKEQQKKLLSLFVFFVMMNDKVIIAKSKNILNGSFTIAEQKEIVNQLPGLIKKLSVENINAQKIESEVKELFEEDRNEKISTQEKKNDENFYYIQNAGLVILHPFLQSLFQGLDMLEEKKIIHAASQRKAILLTQYLITGETEIVESELLLNKIICGYQIEEPVEAILLLTEAEEKESTGLLNSVIEHWTALKTTSVTGLRNSFLLREGKLTEFEDYWLLQVEQRSYDILMNFLPWGIGIIKLPWMQKRIMVEWNS
jgi:hypothetical protein